MERGMAGDRPAGDPVGGSREPRERNLGHARRLSTRSGFLESTGCVVMSRVDEKTPQGRPAAHMRGLGVEGSPQSW
jgi:hypothetical protein